MNTLLLMAGAGGSGGAQGGAGGLSFLVMMVVMIGIMYFIVYRPQAKQRKQLQASISAMKKGDRVLTTGGIYGKVNSVNDNVVVVEIAKDVKVECNKAMIASVVPKK